MRFEEVPLGWTESRLSQEEADSERLGTTELPGKMIEGSVSPPLTSCSQNKVL